MHIIWEALNCLLSVMFECQVSLLSLACIFKTNLAVNCLPATSDWYYHTYAQKWWSGKYIREILSHSRESASISGRLPDDPRGFTCMLLEKIKIMDGHILFQSKQKSYMGWKRQEMFCMWYKRPKSLLVSKKVIEVRKPITGLSLYSPSGLQKTDFLSVQTDF